jgi:hypothetical protein
MIVVMKDFMRTQHYKKIVCFFKKGLLSIELIIFICLLVVGCSPAKPPIQPLTSYQERSLAFHTLTAEHVTIIQRGNQVDVLMPASWLFQPHSSNISPSASSLLEPVYRAIKTYDVETVQVQGILHSNPGHDEKLLTLARAGIIGHDLWFDGLDSQVPIVLGGVRVNDLPNSNLTKDLRAPLIWIHWSYVLTPRMYD